MESITFVFTKDYVLDPASEEYQRMMCTPPGSWCRVEGCPTGRVQRKYANTKEQLLVEMRYKQMLVLVPVGDIECIATSNLK
jgi:hypothetical protein